MEHLERAQNAQICCTCLWCHCNTEASCLLKPETSKVISCYQKSITLTLLTLYSVTQPSLLHDDILKTTLYCVREANMQIHSCKSALRK